MEKYAKVVEGAVQQGLLHHIDECFEDTHTYKPMGMFYNIAAWEANLKGLKLAFDGDRFLHACAVKTNPIGWFLQREAGLGFGAECASVSEVKLALQAGFEPSRVVFDSPCKSLSELQFAVKNGVHVNLDNLQELERLSGLLSKGLDTSSTVGIRINPLVGSGSVKALSVSTSKSKFGVPCPATGAEREELIAAVLRCEWISCIHVHTGSGGMGLNQLCMGARVAVDLAVEINARKPSKQITVIDIGGGLPVNYQDEESKPTFKDYSQELRKNVPELFDNTFNQVVTEFGAALHCKFGWLASRVEYTKTYDGGRIALIHAGSDILVRAAYCPGVFVNYRVSAYDSEGKLKSTDKAEETTLHDIAGPLCFAGDVVAHQVRLPLLSPDDIIVLSDTGGNALSLKTMHCSRPLPAVYGYYQEAGHNVRFVDISTNITEEKVLSLWSVQRSSQKEGDVPQAA